MKLLINYATRRFYRSQKFNTKTGKNIGQFDEVISYRPKDIDPVFWENNKKILLQKRGGGYWIWKPYIIKKAMEHLKDGDFLFYCDSGAHFIKSIDPLIDRCNTSSQDIFPFDVGLIEKAWNKRDAFILMDCDTPQYADTSQRHASFALYRKSEFSCNFVNEWLNLAQDERILTDLKNQMGLPNYPEFKKHRHDQSIFSLLTKKYQLEAYRGPSYWGRNSVEKHYGFLKHTRAKLSLYSYARALLWLYFTRLKES